MAKKDLDPEENKGKDVKDAKGGKDVKKKDKDKKPNIFVRMGRRLKETFSEPKWYILHTYSGYELLVRESLFRLIENNNLGDQIFDVKIPMEQTIEEKANGKKKVVERKLLPCYVFIKMIYSNQLWYLVTNTRGVTGFVGPQGRPVPMKEEEIRKMRLEDFVVDADFTAGDRVSIDNGPLEGFIGTIKECNNETQRAKVTITMFGREQDVEVEYVQMTKISADAVEIPRDEE